MTTYRRILVIRRDNIGDLVLTTPLIHALREHFPQAWIGALTNSYNAPVLAGNPDLDAVYAYDKAKHRPERARVAVAAATAGLLLELRRQRVDLAILAGPGYQRQAAGLVRWIAARAVLGFAEPGQRRHLTMAVDYGAGTQLHAAADVFRLLAPLGIQGAPGPCRMYVDAGARAQITAQLAGRMPPIGGPLVALHISARRARQQWPAERHARVVTELHRLLGCTVMLLWAPGPADDPRHPGDDAKALQVRALVPADVPLAAMPTADLQTLAAALAICDLMVCADGGAMHVATALGKPVVALFGDSPAHRWHPWGVPYTVVQAPGGDLADLAAEPVIAACAALLQQLKPAGSPAAAS
jgi:ADP-heptose:LPS heptosyltransferase